MQVNVGNADRTIRLILGVVLILLPFVSGWAPLEAGFWKWAAIVVGLVLVVTGLSRRCPAYTLFGIDTCRRLP